MSKILDRLDDLEKQNKELLVEIQALREELHKTNPPLAGDLQALQEKVDVDAQRIDEQAQTKVEASQRLPISLTGMFLLDAFLTQGAYNANFNADYGLGQPGGGATLRESIIGLNFHGAPIFGDGRINGFLSMDFYSYAQSENIFRIRRGVVSFDWNHRSLILGQDKSIIAPLQPTSFARVGVPPLAGAGNLWLWRPQVTYEERIPISKTTKATLQASVFETDETDTAPSLVGTGEVGPDRPAAQATAQLEHDWGEQSKFVLGVAGDASASHVLGQSVPSRVISVNFLIKPLPWLEISGTALRGKNFANLGGFPGGVTISEYQSIIPIRGSAGWLQAAFPVTKRLTFDLYGGAQANDARDLNPYGVIRNQTFAGNVLYRIAPNVVLGFEGATNHTEYLNALSFWTTRYDATVAYLF
ncbi:MAG: hypothetical protein JO319_18585 [Acidobacteriaceae bacterium]|nr:hypothetical protein [Acidobacteriaceae bacterium]